MKRMFVFFVSAMVLCAAPAFAESMAVQMNLVDENGIGEAVGSVDLSDSSFGLIITPRLNGLPPGLYGFHVHQNPDCSALNNTPALAAGGHYDPENTEVHGGPYGQGHLGDLPVLYVDPEGNAVTQVLAPRLKVQDIKNRALVIHAGGDNYSDIPEKDGGGGARIACGVVK